MPKGAVIAFDELNMNLVPGETLATMETIGLPNLRLDRRLPFRIVLSVFPRGGWGRRTLMSARRQISPTRQASSVKRMKTVGKLAVWAPAQWSKSCEPCPRPYGQRLTHENLQL